jgi:hypothetical protein
MFRQDALQQKIIKQDKVNFSQWLDRTKNNNCKKKNFFRNNFMCENDSVSK